MLTSFTWISSIVVSTKCATIFNTITISSLLLRFVCCLKFTRHRHLRDNCRTANKEVLNEAKIPPGLTLYTTRGKGLCYEVVEGKGRRIEQRSTQGPTFFFLALATKIPKVARPRVVVPFQRRIALNMVNCSASGKRSLACLILDITRFIDC